MKIEAGKFYKTRDGRKVGPMEVWPQGGWHADRAERPLNGGVWLDDGTSKHVGAKDSPTLISEWLTPHQQRTADMIKVMQAYVDGEKIEDEVRDGVWTENTAPKWSIYSNYRIRQKPDELDWDMVGDLWNYRARDKNGYVYLYEYKPVQSDDHWKVCEGEYARVDAIFASYRKGTTDWKDSLVERPK